MAVHTLFVFSNKSPLHIDLGIGGDHFFLVKKKMVLLSLFGNNSQKVMLTAERN